MRDASLATFLEVLFGVGGVTILIFAWIQTMPVSERIFATFVGSAGILWAIIRIMFLDSKPADN